MILEHVKLRFDPEKSDEEIKAVFADDLARLLWMAVKQQHLTSQFFNNSCLRFAKMIRNYKARKELDDETLYRILSSHADGLSLDAIIGIGDRDFAMELLPFVNGEKVITFEIIA